MQVMQDTDGRIDVMGRIAYGLEAQAGARMNLHSMPSYVFISNVHRGRIKFFPCAREGEGEIQTRPCAI